MEENLCWRNLGKNILNIHLEKHQWITGRKTLKKSQKNDNATVHRRKGRKVKDVVTGARMPAGVISRKMVITIGTGVIKANYPSKPKDFGGHIALTEVWAWGVLKSIEWSKRKGTTGKIEPSKQFLLKEKLTFQWRIASILTWLTEGTYSEFRSNTLVIYFSWEIYF